MKVLESGNKTWSKECRCDNCNAKLLVDKTDLYRRWADDGNYGSYETLFSCPECTYETYIMYDGPNKNDIPVLLTGILETMRNVFSK